MHCALVLEGRDDSELNEGVLCAARVKGIEIDRLAAEGVLGAPMRSPPRA